MPTAQGPAIDSWSDGVGGHAVAERVDCLVRSVPGASEVVWAARRASAEGAARASIDS